MVRVIYILGTAHSGSTLLDLALGNHEPVISTGELWAFPQWVQHNRECSCGDRIEQCAQWSRILKRLRHEVRWKSEVMHRPKELREPGTLWKLRSIWRRQARFNNVNNEKLEEYAAREHVLFRAISDVSGADYIVDSSKRLDRLERLYYSQRFQMKIIHLIRDGRYAVDATRRAAKRRAAHTGEKPRRRYMNSMWIYSGWIINMLGQLNFLSQLDPSSYCRISYEELATKPSPVLQSLCAFIDIDFDPDVLNPLSSRYVFKQEHHIIGGSRLARQGSMNPEMPIKYQDTWERNLSAVDQWVFTLLGGPLVNKKLGIARVDR